MLSTFLTGLLLVRPCRLSGRAAHALAFPAEFSGVNSQKVRDASPVVFKKYWLIQSLIWLKIVFGWELRAAVSLSKQSHLFNFTVKSLASSSVYF